MAKEAVEKFLQRLPDDDNLRSAYAAALNRSMEDAMVEVARTGGFEFTVEELRAVLEEHAAEVPESQLGQVAGGGGVSSTLVGTRTYPGQHSPAGTYASIGQYSAKR